MKSFSMKVKHHSTAAFTRVELIVVILAIAVFVTAIITAQSHWQQSHEIPTN